MKLIKLDAIDSTNEFLKGLSNKQELDNFTVVITEKQTKGKGQMGSVWDSEGGKNLIVSVFIKDPLLKVDQIYNLNIAIAVAVVNVLESYNIPQLSIKWPNDIMSYNFKIGGILIENSLKSDGTISSVVGLGLNINQTNFENLPKASSLAVICKSQFDKELLLFDIIEKVKQNIDLVKEHPEVLWLKYADKLFKKGIPMPFKNNSDKNFMGIIQGVSALGKLQVLLEDDSVSEFGIKEIQMLY
ncbi:biotin--[acetyl-CoA-carboxylase] ligase [uncultured Flavobacterium sp.]|jgi:BirA family biotin operon repressor/biotin-[acetyl-CoA-carboxylase] ligase|uniref:biotin--[acetyl-CoA-carboxylase] ligase n=1 Tax=uncultured Flavobacterium sp. TaxID=165435 RepID=UPI0030EDB3EC|tara:strand:+ start:82324 stop:83052 length:729 start_codon:yes stop_codon:yes gene_type:complete